jgi:hypothetical protein
LVGHVGKVSTILAKDYKPFESADLAEPGEEEKKRFMMERQVVTDKIF